MTIIFTMMIIMSFMFMIMKHPLSLGATLLSQTILISLCSGLMQMNFWYSYILFIIMIGGMLILFMYMTSVASNEKFKFSLKMLMFTVIMFNVLMIINPELMTFYLNFKIQFKNYDLNFSLNKYFNAPNNFIIYLMFFYLLITMIMVTKITKIEMGPLRQMK